MKKKKNKARQRKGKEKGELTHGKVERPGNLQEGNKRER